MRYLVILFLCFSFFAQAQSHIDPALVEQFQQKETVGFIVLLKEQANLDFIPRLASKEVKGELTYSALQKTAKRTQGSVLSLLENTPHRSFLLANAIYAQGNWALVQKIAALPEVKSIMYDTPVQVESSISVEYLNENVLDYRDEVPEWGLKMIKADSVWMEGIKGAGVVVAGQDTGYDWEHPAIKSKYRGDGEVPVHDYNWHDAIHENLSNFPDSIPNPCGFDVMEPCADHPHGTHTIGTMVGYAADHVIGVAPDAQWIGCRNMERGWGTPASYIECFEFFLAPTDLNGENPDVTQAPHVINNSWACPESEGCNPENFEIMNLVVNNLKAAGIVVVVSAGNDGWQGCSSIKNPAAIFENSFTIGATQLVNDTTAFQDSIASFSSRGPVLVDGSGRMKPDVSAPGQSVVSCVPNGGYASYSGTSMAGPHVAGAVALIISANPNLAGMVDTIEYILETTADVKMAVDTCGEVPGEMIPNNTYGKGRINVYKAVQLAQIMLPVAQENLIQKDDLLVLWPNPASATVSLTTLKGEGSFFLINNLGEIVLQQSIRDATQIDIRFLPKGTYFAQFRTASHVETHKLIIQ